MISYPDRSLLPMITGFCIREQPGAGRICSVGDGATSFEASIEESRCEILVKLIVTLFGLNYGGGEFETNKTVILSILLYRARLFFTLLLRA